MSTTEERLARLDQSFAEAEDREPSQQDAPPAQLCICGYLDTDPSWRPPYGHYNEAGGFCCPHYGDSCGYHADSVWW